MRTAVFFATGFEEIEALTVVDVLRRASIHVTMISVMDSKIVTGSHHIPVVCDALFSEVDFTSLKMLILPGGMPGAANLRAHQGLNDLLKQFHLQGGAIGAICAAPFILGELGLLNGRKAVCFPGFENKLFGAILSDQAVVADSAIITAKGAGAAMAFALEIVEYFLGKQKADELADKMIVRR